jgi:arylsulfatase A-like enzyme
MSERWNAVWAIAALHSAVTACAEPKLPNILFVLADDHAAHAIGAYGSQINQTPNIDRLAAEGMRFRNAFVTNSICVPSRATTLTGQYSHVNGVPTLREPLDTSRMTFPKLLREAGYQTAIFGKWHLKTRPAGFDHYEVLYAQGEYYNPSLTSETDSVRYEGYVTDIITDRVLSWLSDGRDRDRPFMLMYHHKAPHADWEPGPDHLTLYDDVTIPEPATLFDDYAGRTSAASTQEMTIAYHLNDRHLKLVPPRGLTEDQLAAWNAAYEPKNEAFRRSNPAGEGYVRWQYQRFIKDYLRTIASVDDNLGRVLDYLDEAGLAENTVVVYSSDQGFFLGDHGWYDKRWMYEESLRIPLIVRWPGKIAGGSVNEDLVLNLDFAETFLELAGVPIPAGMQGRSLVPLLRGETPADWRDAIYYQYYAFPDWHWVPRHYGVRTDQYKLVHYYQIGEWELFDLDADPHELRSVYAEPGYADVVARLKTRLGQLREQYDVPPNDTLTLRGPAPGELAWFRRQVAEKRQRVNR